MITADIANVIIGFGIFVLTLVMVMIMIAEFTKKITTLGCNGH